MLAWLSEIQKYQQLNLKEIRKEQKLILKNKQKLTEKKEIYQLFIHFEIPQIKLNVSDSDDQNTNKWLILSIKDLNSNLMLKSMSGEFTFKISEIEMTDCLRAYKDPSLEKFFTSVNPEDRQKSKDLININIQKLDPTHPDYQNVDLEIAATFGQFFLNYKPLTLVKIMDFFKSNFRDLKRLEREALLPQKANETELHNENTAERNNKIEKGTILAKIAMKWDILSISLIDCETCLKMMDLRLSHVELGLSVSDQELNLNGSLNDLTIGDLTNYPRCLYQEEEYKQIVRKEIFGKTAKNNSKIVDFSFKMILDKEIFISVEISSITCSVYVQLIMKLVDYILLQILEVVNEETDTRQSLTQSVLMRKPPAPPDVQVMIQKIKNPKFMKIDVKMKDFLLYLKPLPDSEEFFIVKLTSIQVGNKILLSNKQIVNKEKVLSKEKHPTELKSLYNELYEVFLRDFVISVQRKGKPLKNVTSKLGFSLVFQGVCFEKEYLACYENLEIDKTIVLRSVLRKASLYMDKYDYDLMLYLTFFNLTYEEQKPWPKDLPTASEDKKPPSKIDFQLDIEEINVLGLSAQVVKGDIDVQPPLFKVSFNDFRLKFLKMPDGNNIQIFGTKMDISHYEISHDQGFIEELSLLSQLDAVERHKIGHDFSAPKDVENFGEGIDENFGEGIDEKSSQFEIMNFDEKHVQFHANITLKPPGSQIVILDVSDIKLLVNPAFFMNLANFAVFDDSLSGPKAKTDEDSEKLAKMGQIVEKSLEILIRINNVSLCLQIPDSHECLTTRGQINFSLQNFQTDQSSQNIEKVFDEKNNVSSMKLHLPEFEIFKCNRAALAKSENLKLLAKRSVIEPISFLFFMRRYENDGKDGLKGKGLKIVLNLSDAMMKVSYQDIIDIIRTVNYLMEINERSKKVVFKGLKLEPSSNIIKKESSNAGIQNKLSKMEESPVEWNIEFSLPNVQLIVISDLGVSFSPFINLIIYESPLSIKMIQFNGHINLLSELILPISSSYYNAQINKWEPIIEKFSFVLDLCYNTNTKPSLVLNIENELGTANLNINFSTEMVKSVFKGVKFIKERAFYEKRDYSFINKDEEINEYVSPYLITNHSGYPLEICSEKPSEHSQIKLKKSFIERKYTVENNASINFQIENDESLFYSASSNLASMTHYLRVSVEILKGTVSYQIPTMMNIQRVHIKEHKVFGGKGPFALISEVVFDAETNQKVLTISSPLRLRNNTQKIIEVRFIEKPNLISMVLNPGDLQPVPFDHINSDMEIRFADMQKWSVLASLGKIAASDSSRQIEMLDKFLMIRSEPENNFKKCLVFEPPLTFKNALPLPMELLLSLSGDQEEKIDDNVKLLEPQNSWDLYDYPPETPLFCRVTIQGFKKSQKNMLNSQKPKEKPRVDLYDLKGWLQTLSVHCHFKNNSARKFYFYARSYIINETYFDLFFQTMVDKRRQVIAGQIRDKDNKILNQNKYANNEKIVLLNEETNIVVSEGGQSNEVSRVITLEVMNDTFTECFSSKGLIQLALRSTMLCVDQDRFLYSKVVSFLPRHVFANMTPFNVAVRQKGCQEVNYIAPYLKKSFSWPDFKKNRSVNLTIGDTDAQNVQVHWGFSQDIDISILGITPVMLRQNEDPSKRKLLKLEIVNEEGLIYILINEYQPNYGPFLLKNMLDGVTIFIKQNLPKNAEVDYPYDRLDSKSQTVYSWDFPMGDKVLLVYFTSDIYEKMAVPLKLANLIQINETYQYILRPKQKNLEPIIVLVVVKLFQDMKVIEFINASTRSIKYEIEMLKPEEVNLVPLNSEPPKPESQVSVKLIMKLKSIGISFIQNTRNPFNELIFLCFKGVELIVLDKNMVRTFQVRLKNLILNNNCSDLVRFPVVVNSSIKNIEATDRFLINMICKKHLDSKHVDVIHSFKLDIEPMRLKIERNWLDSIIEYIEVISQILKKSSDSFQTDIFQNQGNYIFKLDKSFKPTAFDWEIQELKETENQMFFQEILIAPIFLSITFVNQARSRETGEFKLNPMSVLLNSMLSTVANLEDVKLKLTGLQLFNCTDTQAGILYKLETHYKQNMIKELFNTLKIFNMIGHADFVGNPIGLFQNISSGVTDLFEKPAEGFVKGPLEGGKGLFVGAGSLAKNTFTGTFNTVKVITGSLSSGIASLSQDKKYLQEREMKKMKEAKHVGEGLSQGVESIVSGVGQGIMGFFTKPIEGTKKEGVKGLFTGAFQGVTGLLVKPITGVLDAASKTAEGVKNTAYIFDKDKEDQREREIRVFYGYDKFYDSYNLGDVEIMKILKKKKKGRFAGHCYFGFKKFLGSSKDPNNFNFMIFTLETLINYSNSKGKFEWCLPVNNIKAIGKSGGGIKIFLKEHDKKLKMQELWERIDNEVVMNEIAERAIFLLEMHQRIEQIY